MTKRMLIDATNAEETRVVVLDGNRLEDFDVETAAKKQLKGNIYLAKVVRVEPSLQAAFVEYGGGRHGFLAFGEIHPDYYQIPVADRQRLLELQEAEARAEEEAEDAAAAADEAAEQGAQSYSTPLGVHDEAAIPGHDEPAAEDAAAAAADIAAEAEADAVEAEIVEAEASEPERVETETDSHGLAEPPPPEPEHALEQPVDPVYGDQSDITAAIEADAPSEPAPEAPEPAEPASAQTPDEADPTGYAEEDAIHPSPPRAQAAEIAHDVVFGAEPPIETLGADFALEAMEPAPTSTALEVNFEPQPEPQSAGARDGEARDDEPREARAPARFMRSYKIQEVIRRRQILLVQVVKEERGSKGAALTTYLSLAGRFSVLMPNSPRGGGISRKITSTSDRRRLKEVTSELQIPRGMGLIVRTAGANRPKAEIRRDCEYLLDLWDSIRETTMKSIAPMLIHEEASLIKRSIRDNYARDVEEVLVDGEAGWRAARDFMRMLMPAHARKVVLWNDPQPLFARQAVEAQLDAMLVPTVQLKSGGYLVINQTEALVAIDVNSGRSTRERGIEETALKTNLEAADEVARQLRLRDLAGLIVIDFIDMESRRNNAAVEKRMKDALKDDRARIQLGSISSFGLMEMSRQRLRPSLAETSFTPCPHCGGTGHVRSTETSALAVLRAIEEEGAKLRAAEICVHVASAIALYVLNHKRVRLAEIEARYSMAVSFAADESLLPPQTRIEKLRAYVPGEMPEPASAIPIPAAPHAIDADDDSAVEDDDEAEEPEAEAVAGAPLADAEARKRRRRRRGGRRDEREDSVTERSTPPLAEPPGDAVEAADSVDPAVADQPDLPLDGETGLTAAAAAEARGRRRGRRGGRRRRRDEPGGEAGESAPNLPEDTDTDAPASFDAPRPYSGPTPADPFGGGVFDIYDVMAQAEERAAAPPSPPPPPLEAPHRPDAEAGAAEAPVPADAPEPESEPKPSEPEPAAFVQHVPLEYAAEETLPELTTDEAPIATEIAKAPEPAFAAEPAAHDPVPAEALAPEPAAPKPATAELAAPEPATLEHATPEPAAPEPATAERGAPEPTAPEPRPEPVAGPVSTPVLIGAEPTADKKRGWWRR